MLRRPRCLPEYSCNALSKASLPCCDSLGVRREAKKAGEAMPGELDRVDEEGVAW
jgi:hypothetical protein